MISSFHSPQHLVCTLIKILQVVQIETRRYLPLLINMKVHYLLCKMMLGQLSKHGDVGQILLRHPLVYGVLHPYMYAVTAVIRLFEPLFKAIERVHTSFKFGDNMYLKLAANDIRGRLNARFQLSGGGGWR